MRIITPLTVDETILTSTNVAEMDYAVWSGVTTYALGDRRIKAHKIWESLQASNTNHDPVTDDGTWWIQVSATNRYKMYDAVISTQTENSGSIEVEMTPGEVVNGIALLGLVGQTVEIIVTDPVDGIVYDEVIDLQDSSPVTDWYTYFFEDIQYREDVVRLDLPSYPDAVIDVTIDNLADTAKCGEMVIGRQRDLGMANFNTSVGIKTYSTKTTDDFGNVTIVKRAFAKRADFDVTLDTDRVYIVQRILAQIRDTPTVYVGDEDRGETIIYGFWTQFNIVLTDQTWSDCSLEVEGLV
jgi:hypothetical protein